MASEVKKIYEFGKFRFDPQKLRLEHDGAAVQLPPKSLETLKVLLEEKGIVTREDFLNKVWGESFVEDANLTVAVSTLRKALAAFDKDKTFIQTVPGRGYRFIGDAQERIEISEQPIIVQRHKLEHLTVEQTSPKTFSKVFIAIALVGLIASATAFAVWLGRDKATLSAQNANPAAAEAFQKGDALLQKRQVCESIPYFREAITSDQTDARAYSNLAASLAMCSDSENESDRAIAKALDLDPTLAEAHATDGFIKLFRHWDWDGAETALKRAVALDPNSAKAHHWLGVSLSIRGRLLEAQAEMKRAIEIAPDSPLYQADLCQVYYFERNTATALNYCQKALELDPNFIFTPVYLRDIHLLQGDEQKAFEYQKKDWMINGWSPEAVKQGETDFKRGGFKALYQKGVQNALTEIKLNSSRGAATSMDLAQAYARLGDKENTLRWLEETVSAKKGTVPFSAAYLGVLPHYAFLRNESRFQAVLQKINLGY